MSKEKTNAARILDKLGIGYELVEYSVDPENLAADHVAAELGEPIEQVFKTLDFSYKHLPMATNSLV